MVTRKRSSLPWQIKLKQIVYAYISGAIVLAIACGFLSLYTSFLLNRELSAIAQKGEPISNTQALPQAIPLTQNAAPLYQQAVDKSQLKPSLDCDDLSDQEITEILERI